MEMLYSDEVIHDKITELCYQLIKDNDNMNNAVSVGILNGSIHFYSDMLRCLQTIGVDLSMEFISAKSYISNREQSEVNIYKITNFDIKGKDVYIFEDIIDSGNTIKELKRVLQKSNPKSIKVISLLRRHSCKEPIEYVGFTIPDESWVIGFGLDDNQKSRNLRHIYKIN